MTAGSLLGALLLAAWSQVDWSQVDSLWQLYAVRIGIGAASSPRPDAAPSPPPRSWTPRHAQCHSASATTMPKNAAPRPATMLAATLSTAYAWIRTSSNRRVS